MTSVSETPRRALKSKQVDPSSPYRVPSAATAFSAIPTHIIRNAAVSGISEPRTYNANLYKQPLSSSEANAIHSPTTGSQSDIQRMMTVESSLLNRDEMVPYVTRAQQDDQRIGAQIKGERGIGIGALELVSPEQSSAKNTGAIGSSPKRSPQSHYNHSQHSPIHLSNDGFNPNHNAQHSPNKYLNYKPQEEDRPHRYLSSYSWDHDVVIFWVVAPAFCVILGTAGRAFFYSLACGVLLCGLLDHLGQGEAAFVGNWFTAFSCVVSIVLWSPYVTTVSTFMSLFLLLNACILILLVSCWASLHFSFAHNSLLPITVYFERVLFGLLPFTSSSLLVAACMGAAGAEYASFYALVWCSWCFIPMMIPRISCVRQIESDRIRRSLISPAAFLPSNEQSDQSSPSNLHEPKNSSHTTFGSSPKMTLPHMTIHEHQNEDESNDESDDANHSHAEWDNLDFDESQSHDLKLLGTKHFQRTSSERLSYQLDSPFPNQSDSSTTWNKSDASESLNSSFAKGSFAPYINSDVVSMMHFYSNALLPTVIHVCSSTESWVSLRFICVSIILLGVPLAHSFLLASTDMLWWVKVRSTSINDLASTLNALVLPAILIASYTLFLAPALDPFLTLNLWPRISHLLMFFSFMSVMGAIVLVAAGSPKNLPLQTKPASEQSKSAFVYVAPKHNGVNVVPPLDSLIHSLVKYLTSPRWINLLLFSKQFDPSGFRFSRELHPDAYRKCAIYVLAALSCISASIALGVTPPAFLLVMLPLASSIAIFFTHYSLIAGLIASLTTFVAWMYFLDSTLYWLGELQLEDGLSLRDICNMISLMFVCFLILIVLHIAQGDNLYIRKKEFGRKGIGFAGEISFILHSALSRIADIALVIYTLVLFIVERTLTTHSLAINKPVYSRILSIMTTCLGLLGITRLVSRGRISPIAHWFTSVLLIAKLSVLFTDDFRDIMHGLLLSSVLSPLYFYYPSLSVSNRVDGRRESLSKQPIGVPKRSKQIPSNNPLTQSRKQNNEADPVMLKPANEVTNAHLNHISLGNQLPPLLSKPGSPKKESQIVSTPIAILHCIAIFIAFCVVRRSILYHLVVAITGNRPTLSGSWAFVVFFTVICCAPIAFWYIGYSERARRACVLLVFLSIFVAAINPDFHSLSAFVPGLDKLAISTRYHQNYNIDHPDSSSAIAPFISDVLYDFMFRTSYHDEAVVFHSTRRRLRAIRAASLESSSMWIRPWSLLFAVVSAAVLLTHSTSPMARSLIATIVGAGLGVFFVNMAFPTLTVDTKAILTAAKRWHMGQGEAVDVAERVSNLANSQKMARALVLVAFILAALMFARLWNLVSRKISPRASALLRREQMLKIQSESFYSSTLVWHYIALMICFIACGMQNAVRDRSIAMAALAPQVATLPPYVVLLGLIAAINFLIAVVVRIVGDRESQSRMDKMMIKPSSEAATVGNLATMTCYLSAYLVHILYFDGSDLAVPLLCLVFVLLTPHAPLLGIPTSSRFGPAFAALSGTLISTTALKLVAPKLVISTVRRLHDRISSNAPLYSDPNLAGLSVDLSAFVDEINLSWVWRLLNLLLLALTIPGLWVTLKYEYSLRYISLTYVLVIIPLNFFPLFASDLRGTRMLAVASILGVLYTHMRSYFQKERNPIRSVH